ncbi:hypothetical protein CRM22_007964, partial [Opisthorchis felineus]
VRRGFTFSSDTDTEVIPKLMQHIYDRHTETKPLTFLEVVELVVKQLVSFTFSVVSGYVFVCLNGNVAVISIEDRNAAVDTYGFRQYF